MRSRLTARPNVINIGLIWVIYPYNFKMKLKTAPPLAISYGNQARSWLFLGVGLCLILWTFSGQTTSAAGARGERRRREAPVGGPGVLPRKIFENWCTLVHFQSILRQDGAHFVIDNRVTFSYKIPYIEKYWNQIYLVSNVTPNSTNADGAFGYHSFILST